METLGKNKLFETIRIRICNAYVKHVLLYNCGAWVVTVTTIKALESFHRSQLRRVVAIHYPEHVSNKEVYCRCGKKFYPLRYDLLKARWKSFGHILRRKENIPANLEMELYFNYKGKKSYKLHVGIFYHNKI